MRMASGMSTPSSLADGSLVNFVEDLEGALRASAPAVQSKYEEAIRALEAAQRELGVYKLRNEELEVQVTQAEQERVRMDRQYETTLDANAAFGRRHDEIKATMKDLETKYSEALAEVKWLEGLYAKAEAEITALKSPRRSLAGETLVEEGNHDGFDDLVVLSVEDALYRVSRRLLKRETEYFDSQLAARASAGSRDQAPIVLVDVTISDMKAFLTFLHASPFNNDFDFVPLRDWTSILKLSTKWNCNAIRSYVINVFETRFKACDPFERLVLAFDCQIPQWVHPSYDTICRREERLTAQEGRLLGWERFAAICDVRERFAKGQLVASPGTYDYLQGFSTTRPALTSEAEPITAPPVLEKDKGSETPRLKDEIPQPSKKSADTLRNEALDQFFQSFVKKHPDSITPPTQLDISQTVPITDSAQTISLDSPVNELRAARPRALPDFRSPVLASDAELPARKRDAISPIHSRAPSPSGSRLVGPGSDAARHLAMEHAKHMEAEARAWFEDQRKKVNGGQTNKVKAKTLSKKASKPAGIQTTAS